MKKLSSLCLAAIALIGFTACNPDTDPKIDTSKKFTFVMNTPQFATQFIDLSTRGTLTFTVSQPDYGLTIAPTYGLQISLKSDFTAITDQPVIDANGEEHIVVPAYNLTVQSQDAGVLKVSMEDVAAGINELNGIYDEASYKGDYEGPVYVRATSALDAGASALSNPVYSNVVTLTQVKGFAEFPSSAMALSVPGGGNGWNHLPQLISEDGMTYRGFAYISGGFKITDGDWDGTGNWGASDEGTEGITANADGTYSAPLIQRQDSEHNFNNEGNALAAGLYFIQVDVTNMTAGDGETAGTMVITPINSICVIGDYCGWGFETAVEMENTGNYTVWKASGDFTSAGWKFAFNGNWTVNLGGDVNELWFDGANINMDASEVTLNLEQYPWTTTVQ